MKYLKLAVVVFWYALYVELALTFYQSVLSKTWGQPIAFTKAILGLLLLTSFFVLVHLAVRTVTGQRPAVEPTTVSAPLPTAFPSELTVRVGVWLLALTGFLIVGLFFILNSIGWPDWLLKFAEKAPDFTNAAATMFGAGIGSTVATILAYLEHASEKKDFEAAYVPWYVARPLMGMMLGLIFYFLLREGLVAVVTNNSTAENLSEAGLTGIGALVGLFSKEAIEKLRELFNTLFSTRRSVEESFVARLPSQLQADVRHYLGGRSNAGAGSDSPGGSV